MLPCINGALGTSAFSFLGRVKSGAGLRPCSKGSADAAVAGSPAPPGPGVPYGARRVRCHISDARVMIALINTDGRERVERRLAAILAADVAG